MGQAYGDWYERTETGSAIMKLCRFTRQGQTRIGKVAGGRVVDLSGVPGVGESMRALIATLPRLRAALQGAAAPCFALSDVKLEAPIGDPQKYLAIGMNYRAHADEVAAAGVPVPTSQLWFNKQVSCINGPFDAIELPRVSGKLDYEAELGVVIGARCHDVSEADALSVVAGYLVCNDVSVRDWQMRSPTFTLGKSFDTHGPIGPWITTADEVADPQALMLHLTVNGQERQRSSTAEMTHWPPRTRAAPNARSRSSRWLMPFNSGRISVSDPTAGAKSAMAPARS
jgi:2-keto-4-pentenoate hydratase/2-oxohepta-3-ene-1,7-dioic acid hydratase in catechol pathway